MGDYPKKEIELIENQIKRINKEEERRLAELKSKQAGKEIENFEIRRKRKIIESLIKRINLNISSINALIKIFLDKTELSIKKRLILFIGGDCISCYQSIKKDLGYTFKDDSKIEELFPTIKIENINSLDIDDNHFFFSMLRQELDLLEYLNRFR